MKTRRKKRTFFLAEKRIFRDKKEVPTFRLPPLVETVYRILESYAWGDKFEAFPSLSTIHRQVLASKQSIVEALYFLNGIKLIQIGKDKNIHGGRDKNIYFIRELNDEDIEEIKALIPVGLEFLKKRKTYRWERARLRHETVDEPDEVQPQNHARSSRATNKKTKGNDKKGKR